MRNLKKFLALVLAMMMTLSLMVTVNAKNVEFDDGETVNDAFIDDLTVLAGMGVIKGMGDGTFKPQTTVTRAEMAAIVYRLRTGDADADPEYKDKSMMFAGYGEFTDVKDGDWFQGYVGYCANGGLILGDGDGKFRPNDPVTGYEALVMLLRAMGYDQPGTFTGDDWRQRAATIASQRGMLAKVDTTSYRGNLMGGAAREVIAEITFQAATKATVKYDGVNYESSSWAASADGNLTRVENPTLGYISYGLTGIEAVVLGNQATGEKATILGTAGSVVKDDAGTDKTIAWTEYDFPGTTITNGGVNHKVPKLAVDAVTGVDLFAHNVKVWYDADSGSTKTAYAVFDQADSTVIKTGAGVKSLSGTTDDISDSLPTGWKIDTTDGVYSNEFFSQFNANNTTAAAPITGTNDVDASPVDLYEIIDNDGDGVVDVVIALNIQTTKIVGRNDVGTVPYVGVTTDKDNGTKGTDFISGNNVVGTYNEGRIAQAALSADSDKTLSDYVMGYHVAGTTPRTLKAPETTASAWVPTKTADEDAYFSLKKIDQYVDSKVLAVNPTTNALTIEGGKTLEQSMYYDTVVGGSGGALGSIVTLPQQTSYSNQTYRIWLDEDGDYLGAELILANEFVYGTYADVNSPMGSSSFTYQLVGVDMNGKEVTKTVTKVIDKDGNVKDIDTLELILGTDGTDTTALTKKVPYRDDNNAKSIIAGQYTGFAVNSTGTLNPTLDSTTLTIPMLKGDNGDLDWTAGFNHDSTGAGGTPDELLIGAAEKKMGAVKVAEYDTTHNVYFTEKTKFIVVSGNGTDTLDPKVYTGISGLLGDNVSVSFGDLDADKTTATSGSNLDTGIDLNQMIYFSSSDFVYAQDRDYAPINVDTVFIPAAALTYTSSSGLYYAGDVNPTLEDAVDNTVKQYTLYVGGEKQSVWLDAAPTTDTFHTLQLSSKKTAEGGAVYTPTALTATTAPAYDAVWASGGAAYTAQTWDTDTAMIGSTLYRIGKDVKVVNVNKDNTAANIKWPGVDSLATLNAASSLDATSAVKVNAVLNADGELALIYVCFGQ